MSEAVIDASVVLAWFLPDTAKRHTFASAILDRLMAGTLEVWAPPIFVHEVAKGLVMGERRGNLAAADLDQAQRLLRSTVINIHHDLLSVDNLVDAAKRLHCQVYDAAYVVLADEQGLPLLTLDGGMLQACQIQGVECNAP